MSLLINTGSMCKCAFGMIPTPLTATNTARTQCSSTPALTIMDFAPMVNIKPFGMCTTPSNPTVAAATAAALGVLTPMPCIPATTAPWTPGSPTVLIGGIPALNNSSVCVCAWGGVISIVTPGQAQCQIP